MARRSGRKAVFLDRDGTLNVEVNYLQRVDDLVLVPGAAGALRALREAGYLLVVVTNQAGIARGYFDRAALETLHERLASLLAADGARLDAIYFCPHHPDFTGACECRKPAPGMLLQAADELGIDLQRSWMVGDTMADIAAGRAAGCRGIMVRTGYGASYGDPPDGEVRPEAVVEDIGAAARLILHHEAAGW